MEALKRNIKDKLPLTRDEKYEAAWTLVREGRLSARAITEATTASRRTIQSMRKAAKSLGKAAQDVSWIEARRGLWKPDEEYDADAHRREKAQKVAKAILRNTGVSLKRDPRILADALEILDSRIPDFMILSWAQRVKPLMEKYPIEFSDALSLDI